MQVTAASFVPSAVSSARTHCRHCGDACGTDAIRTDTGTFCCAGCESVFGILHQHGLEAFYALDAAAGTSQKAAADRDSSRFAALDDPEIASRLIAYDDGQVARATLAIPAIHCASCVWLLEQLWRLDAGVLRAEVDLLRRAVHVQFRPGATTLRRIAEQMAALGYEPALTVEDRAGRVPAATRRLYMQLGVAGFAFGNIMLFSIPRYANGAPLEGGFQRLFDILNIVFALPVLCFSAADYFRTAWHALRTRTMALEVPVAIGLVVLFARSVADIALSRGEGFMDSFAGLVFFLLIGRLFQQKVFERVAFDRTFRSFLPLSVQVERGDSLAAEAIDRLRVGDIIVVRPHEVVPADAVLLDSAAAVDYSFLSGEQTPVPVMVGDTVRAGGRVSGRAMRLRVLREVSHSQLAGFWSQQVFSRPKHYWLTDVAARFGSWFTFGAIGLALAGAAAWWPDMSASASVATAVLIVACPCALTLSAPITLGTAMGMLGMRGLYLKQPAVVLDLSRIDTVAFDKTGTLTTADGAVHIEPHGLSERAVALAARLAAESVHPASRAIAAATGAAGTASRAQQVQEVVGAGLSGVVDGCPVAIGNASFMAAHTGLPGAGPADATCVAAGDERGWMRISTPVRDGIERAAAALTADHELCLLSGDHDGERPRWAAVFGSRMRFRQTPADKLAFVEEARARGRHLLMVGDGLNDAGALAAADVGMAVSDATACMAPACDAVISGERLADLPAFLAYARRARRVVIACFIVSVVYNVLGLTLALTGALTPLASAILMPVSSLTVVAISSGAMRWAARKGLPS